MNPAADHVAAAIVAACRETGDDPVAVAEQITGCRARHYAVHALAKVFPQANRTKLSEWVGCPGKGQHFWHNSCNQIANPTSLTGPKRMVKWWSADVFRKVVAAIEAVEKAPSHPPEPKRTADAGIVKIAKVAESREAAPVPRGPERAPDPVSRPAPGGIAHGKRALYEMLGQAVKNTAKMPKGD